MVPPLADFITVRDEQQFEAASSNAGDMARVWV